MKFNFIRFISVHSFNQTLPLGIHCPRPIRFIHYNEFSACFENSLNLIETMFDVRPEVNRLKSCQYWQRWGAKEFYRDKDCVYYKLEFSIQHSRL